MIIMNKKLWIPFTVLALAALACGPVNITVNIPKVTTGPTQTFTVNEPLPDSKSAVDVTLAMGAGEFNLSGGGDGLLNGAVQYNVPEWKPTLTRGTTSLTLEQGQNDVNGLPGSDVINRWDLKLGNAPMNLTVRAGAYRGEMDLSGVPLQSLDINDGASDSTVVFSSLNPEKMSTFTYRSGASSVNLRGLAWANFKSMEFDGGAGSYSLDFTGNLQQDADVTINGGVGSLMISVPKSTAARVMVTRGLGSVSSDSGWTSSGDTYSTSGKGSTLTITVKMGVGSLELVTR
jgi:hypothetical protein